MSKAKASGEEVEGMGTVLGYLRYSKGILL